MEHMRTARPFLLSFLEPVEPMFAPPPSYDPVTQCDQDDGVWCGTQRSKSYQNRTSSPSVLTGYEDYDDEYVTTTD